MGIGKTLGTILLMAGIGYGGFWYGRHTATWKDVVRNSKSPSQIAQLREQIEQKYLSLKEHISHISNELPEQDDYIAKVKEQYNKIPEENTPFGSEDSSTWYNRK